MQKRRFKYQCPDKDSLQGISYTNTKISYNLQPLLVDGLDRISRLSLALARRDFMLSDGWEICKDSFSLNQFRGDALDVLAVLRRKHSVSPIGT